MEILVGISLVASMARPVKSRRNADNASGREDSFRKEEQ